MKVVQAPCENGDSVQSSHSKDGVTRFPAQRDLRVNLRLADVPPSYSENIEFWRGDRESGSHSLHHAIHYPVSYRPEIASHCLDRFSKKGDVVFDPFCGSGTTGLEAAIRGRLSIQSDRNPVAVEISSSKLAPADLAEVTLALQSFLIKRPVEMGPYSDLFSQFYHVDTFREIVNLRSILAERNDRVSRFVRLVALALLHGHSSGYFSAFSSPSESVTPEEQARLNLKRGQKPEYRPVLPRILRKAAALLREGIPSFVLGTQDKHVCRVSDARSLEWMSPSSVDLVLTEPPCPGMPQCVREQWLRFWFLGLPANDLHRELWSGIELSDWLGFMNEVSLELARVVKGGGRAIFLLPNSPELGDLGSISRPLIKMIEQSLGRFWYPECILTHSGQRNVISRGRIGSNEKNGAQALVIRRR